MRKLRRLYNKAIKKQSNNKAMKLQDLREGLPEFKVTPQGLTEYVKYNGRIYTKRYSPIEKRKNDSIKFDKGGRMVQYNQDDPKGDTISTLSGPTTSGGFIELSEGFTIQWGRVFHDEADVDFKFKKKFRFSCFGVFLNRQFDGIHGYNATNITASGFTIDTGATVVGDRFVNYMAIGH